MPLKENVNVKFEKQGILSLIVLWLSTATSIVLCCCCPLCVDMTKCLLTTRGLLAMQLGFYKLNCSLVTALQTSVAALTTTLMRWENFFKEAKEKNPKLTTINYIPYGQSSVEPHIIM